jgi:hypothetical protein
MQTVSPAECSTFADYVSDEAEAFPGKLSATFMNSVLRFVKAKCTARDAQGEIQLITMNDQDGASLGTALRRMGGYDIRGISGVRGCHRPTNGTCPATTSSNSPKAGSG